MKLRSLRLLYDNLMYAYGMSSSPEIEIATYQKVDDRVDDAYRNMIFNTLQTLSAVIGGADLIFTNTLNPDSQGTAIDQRIAINVHHIMRYESDLDKVVDPVQGSYFFESLTDKICQSVWTDFESEAQ